jgi:hypothetical protein
MSAVDEKVERGAEKLERLVEAGSRAGGVKAKIARLFADDPEFLRQLKPSLIAARARGEAPTDEEPAPVEPPAPRPQPPPRATEKSKGGGPSPFVVLGAALAVGVALAHVLDWLGHRYPRD